MNRIQPLLETAREAGVSVEEIDEDHVRLRYDALERDQWLAVEAIFDGVQELASLEGDGHTDAAPDNWMGIHFDFSSCEQSLKP